MSQIITEEYPKKPAEPTTPEESWEFENPMISSEAGKLALMGLKLDLIREAIREIKIDIINLSPEERTTRIMDLAAEVASNLNIPVDKAMKVVITIWNSINSN